ncbi:hypothetical protein [Lysinibacillus sphaericus]|uniref:hypothetical protein n=1 Tax=Lysinibacillus sphaericus TaxID=1421 RepID=UPI00163B65B4|nr:hypothetical protein [Lysinibacillus sp. SDF0037]
MTHFEYMEQQGQLTIFDLLNQYEEMEIRKPSADDNKAVDKNKVIESRIRVCIVRR